MGLTTAVIVPVKSFRRAKERLAKHLEPEHRQVLARRLATEVVTAVAPAPVFVACDDDEVATWARSLHAEVLWGPGLGLNGAVAQAIERLGNLGYERVLISHSDLVAPASLLPLLDPASSMRLALDVTVLVPDRRRDGTNVICISTALAFRPSYGPGSFQRHLQQAVASGRPVLVHTDEHLALDIDTWDDLLDPMARHLLLPATAPHRSPSTSPTTLRSASP
jgi:2-phospho-L-lactate guanylyltransferase